MISTLAPSPAQKARSLSVAAGSVASGGVRMHQRLMNSSAKPESGPECSVPATGCAGTKCTFAGRFGAISHAPAREVGSPADLKHTHCLILVAGVCPGPAIQDPVHPPTPYLYDQSAIT